MRNSKPLLLVEDDGVDAMTVKRAIKELKVTNKLIHTLNGEEALQYLRDTGNRKRVLSCWI
jgi:ActR/RegA family two-component response regulator